MGLFSSLMQNQGGIQPPVMRQPPEDMRNQMYKTPGGGGGGGGGYAGEGKSFLDTFLRLALGTGGGGSSQEQEQDDFEMTQGTLPTGYYERAPGGLPQIHAGRY